MSYMQIELGNVAPLSTEGRAPVVTYCAVPLDYTYVVADSAADLARDVALHLVQNPGMVTHLPEQEALQAVIAAWREESLSLIHI